MSFKARVRVGLLDESRVAMALRLTALFFIVNLSQFVAWHPVALLLPAVALVMLLSREIRESRGAWWVIFAVLAWGLVQRWTVTENNRFLDAYWCLACALALGVADPETALARSARLLIGLAFTLAATQKLLRGEYLDGSFMHGTILWDPRFAIFARLGGVDAHALHANQQLQAAIAQFPGSVESITLSSSDRLRWLARGLSYWVLFVEGSIGLSFLLPRPVWLVRWRDYWLMLFVVPTYLLAQVPQFGMILVVMGFAQCDSKRTGMRLAYLTAFVFVACSDFTGSFLVDAVTRMLG